MHASFLFGWFSNLQIAAISSSETSAHVRTTQRSTPEDGTINNSNICNYVKYEVDGIADCNEWNAEHLVSHIEWLSQRISRNLATLRLCLLLFCKHHSKSFISDSYHSISRRSCSPKIQQDVSCLLLLHLFLDPENGGNIFLRNICEFLPINRFATQDVQFLC
jgi:hypothetical protein